MGPGIQSIRVGHTGPEGWVMAGPEDLKIAFSFETKAFSQAVNRFALQYKGEVGKIPEGCGMDGMCRSTGDQIGVLPREILLGHHPTPVMKRA